MPLPESLSAGGTSHLQHHEEIHQAINQRAQEIAYAERVTEYATSSTSEGVAVPGLSITFTVDGLTPILLDAWAMGSNNNTGGVAELSIFEGSTRIIFDIAGPSTISGNHLGGQTAMIPRIRITPTSGSHTYYLALRSIAAGESRIGTNGWPSFIRAVTVDAA